MGNLISSPTAGIDGLGLEIPESYNLPRPTQESTTKLQQLIRANNTTYGTLRNQRRFHNHLPHAIVSAYFLGASPKQLTYIYDTQSKNLVPWKEDSPTEVTDEDWTEYLGKREYERGFFDFFTDRIVDAKFNWASIVERFFVKEEVSLQPGVLGGLTHPLIHLGYAFECDNAQLAAEALTLSATNYDELLKGVTIPDLNDTTADPVEVFNEIRSDATFDGIYEEPFEDTPKEVAERFPDKVAYYTARLALDSDDIEGSLKTLLAASAQVFAVTHKDDDPQFDFFLLHLLTSTHELTEILLNPSHGQIFKQSAASMVRAQWAAVVLLYISEMRPLVKPERVNSVEIEDIPTAWSHSVALVLNGPARTDSHFIKAVRALLFAERFICPDEPDAFYAKAALLFAENFSRKPEYAGFTGRPLLDVKH